MIKETGAAYASKMAGKEDREAAAALCRVLNDASGIGIDHMFSVAADLEMPEGFWNARFIHAGTKECVSGICNFGDTPVKPYDIMISIDCLTSMFGEFYELNLIPTKIYGTLELEVTFADRGYPWQ